MSLDTTVLRALLRLARRRTPPTLEQLVVRVGTPESDVRKSLASLARSGLVQRTRDENGGLRLSLAGLAVAVAAAAAGRGAEAQQRQAPAKVSARRSEARAA
jgi:DNA-binding IscR family transcriptional regulator